MNEDIEIEWSVEMVDQHSISNVCIGMFGYIDHRLNYMQIIIVPLKCMYNNVAGNFCTKLYKPLGGFRVLLYQPNELTIVFFPSV